MSELDKKIEQINGKAAKFSAYSWDVGALLNALRQSEHLWAEEYRTFSNLLARRVALPPATARALMGVAAMVAREDVIKRGWTVYREILGAPPEIKPRLIAAIQGGASRVAIAEMRRPATRASVVSPSIVLGSRAIQQLRRIATARGCSATEVVERLIADAARGRSCAA